MSVLSKLIWNLELTDIQDSPIFWYVMVLDHIVIAFFFLLIEIMWKKQKIDKGSSQNGYFVLLLVGQVLLLIPNVVNPYETPKVLTMVSLIGVLMGVVFCIMLPVIVAETEKREIAEAELDELNRSYELEEIYLKLLEQKQDQMSKIRHDFNNQLMIALALINSGKVTEAEEILQELEEYIKKKDCFD